MDTFNDDVLFHIFLHTLPPRAEGYLSARAFARLCYSASCCKAWSRAWKNFIRGARLGEQGGLLHLLCYGSDAEFTWLSSLPPQSCAVKLTHQEDPQQGAWELVWGSSNGGGRRSSGSAAALVACRREEGLEARRKNVLESLPLSVAELFLDFEDGAPDLGWLPQLRPVLLRLLHLRSPADFYIGHREVELLAAAAEGLEVDAPRMLVSVGTMSGVRGSPAERVAAGMALAAATLGPFSRLRLRFKDLALLQVDPACTLRVSLLQLLQRGGLERVECTLGEGHRVEQAQHAQHGAGQESEGQQGQQAQQHQEGEEEGHKEGDQQGVREERGKGWAWLQRLPDRPFWYELRVERAAEAEQQEPSEVREGAPATEEGVAAGVAALTFS